MGAELLGNFWPVEECPLAGVALSNVDVLEGRRAAIPSSQFCSGVVEKCAPDRMKLRTPMSLFAHYNFGDAIMGPSSPRADDSCRRAPVSVARKTAW